MIQWPLGLRRSRDRLCIRKPREPRLLRGNGVAELGVLTSYPTHPVGIASGKMVISGEEKLSFYQEEPTLYSETSLDNLKLS
ncbi:hypothetical protein D5086_000338 [Populus alba]|uniref:Uncharacterized protein n=1 Tax=Populus alba TaxID=43335 RepID=A0ACC4CWT3_POPAL